MQCVKCTKCSKRLGDVPFKILFLKDVSIQTPSSYPSYLDLLPISLCEPLHRKRPDDDSDLEQDEDLDERVVEERAVLRVRKPGQRQTERENPSAEICRSLVNWADCYRTDGDNWSGGDSVVLNLTQLPRVWLGIVLGGKTN